MLPQWLRSPSSRVHSTSRPPLSRNFSCSSFKDVHALLKDESESESESHHHLSKKPSIFHRVRLSTSFRPLAHHNAIPSSNLSITVPNADQRIIIYFTSLHVVRRTFEDCRTVRSILRGFRAPVDERDVSMDAMFLDELQGITGFKKLALPSVFIGGIYMGGAEEIQRLHEGGELKKLIGRLPMEDRTLCDVCVGLNFLVCEQCNGSHKIYMEKLGFRGCSACNANGLIRCPSCCPNMHPMQRSIP